ncbi:peptide deformylase [Chloroflexota bacterium]
MSMAMLEVVVVESAAAPVLRKRAKRVTQFDDKLSAFIDDMVETMGKASGVGLAAPQVNASQRIVVVRLPDDENSREEFGEQAGQLFEIVNPQITKGSKEMVDGVEACLSIPGVFGEVSRHESITVKGQDRTGDKLLIKADGWLARVFQHEIDHLDGVLFTDLATELWQDLPGEAVDEDGMILETQPSPVEIEADK